MLKRCWHIAPYDVLHQYVLMPGKVHADDIPVPVQEPSSGKTRTAWLWIYICDDRNVGSEMSRRSGLRTVRTGKAYHPQTHLAGYWRQNAMRCGRTSPD
ncbi:TPA: transposase [Salmonella enterica]